MPDARNRDQLGGCRSEGPLKAILLIAGLGVALAAAVMSFVVVRPHSATSALPSAHAPATYPGSRPARDDCMAAPHLCGFPDGTNTGVPAGITLKTVPGQVSSGPGWHFDSRGWVQVDGAGAVLSGLYIPYTVNIVASHVTVKDVKVVTSGQSSFGIAVRHTSGVTIENSTISGLNAGAGRVMAGIKDIYSDSTRLAVLDNNISWASTGVQMESGLIQGNYIHNMGDIAGDHLDGIHSTGGGTRLLTIQHNTIFNNFSQTGAIVLTEDFGAQANRVINDNLLAGGGYTIYAGQNSGGPATSNIKVTNNRIGGIYYRHGGQYGPLAGFNTTRTVWSGNVWDASGHTIPAKRPLQQQS